jgi:D-glycero-alpha-D-manno-heptose-7-phosphate kinase
MIITQTPLRISFFGGGSDFKDFYREEEGCVLSSAIDKFIHVIAKRRYDPMIRVGYSRTELVNSVEEIQHDLVRESLKIAGVRERIEIGTMADIPSTGSGLGSSSAVTVGVLNALYSFENDPQPLEVLAQKACEVEIGRLSRPIGKQDQYIAAYGGLRFIRFLPDEQVVVERVVINEGGLRRFNQHLMLFYTNHGRQAATILNEQVENIRGRMHVLRELKSMAYTARGLLEQGNFDDFGRMLHESWQLKKTLASKISNSEIDELYAKARKAGALGGKITGAGGGGYLLLYCPREKQYEVRAALSGLDELPFHLESDSSKVIFNYRR